MGNPWKNLIFGKKINDDLIIVNRMIHALAQTKLSRNYEENYSELCSYPS